MNSVYGRSGARVDPTNPSPRPVRIGEAQRTRSQLVQWTRPVQRTSQTFESMRRFFSSPVKEHVKAAILDGAGLSKAWQAELAKEAAEVEQKLGRPPGLAVVTVGSRPDSTLYIQRKQEACARVGIVSCLNRLKEDASQAELEGVVRYFCSRRDVDGVIVQLPLPPHLNEEAVIDAFDPSKDVDGRLIMQNRQRSLIPCTALGCMELLTRSDINLRGKEAVLMGDSNVVGTPLAMLLRDSGIAALTLCSRRSMQALFDDREQGVGRAPSGACLPRLPGPLPTPEAGPSAAAGSRAAQRGPQQPVHEAAYPVAPRRMDRENDQMQQGDTHASRSSESFDMPAITRRADILVVAVGNPELVKADWIKPGAVVLDVGINVVSGDGKQQQQRVVGDVAFEEVSQVAAAVTPVPGGIGPMTIAAVLHNTIQAAWMHAGEQHEPSSRYAAGSSG